MTTKNSYTASNINKDLKRQRAISVSLAILAVVAVFYVLAVGKKVLVPLAVAVMIWYIINALSRAYARWRPGTSNQQNWLTLLASLVTIGVVVTLVVDMVNNNISQVSAAAPTYKANVDRLLERFGGVFGLEALPSIPQLYESIDLAPLVSNFAKFLTSVAGKAGLILIYVLFLLIEQKTFPTKLRALFPDADRHNEVQDVLHQTQEDIQTYIWIKTLASFATGIFSYMVLRWVGVDYAEFWAFTIFLLNYIPTVGSIVATIFPALLTLIQFDTIAPFVIVVVSLTLIQFVIGSLLEPRLMGSSLNLSPLIVVLSLTLWGSLWGVAGMFLCVPITVMLMIVLAHFESTRPIARLLSGNGKLNFVDI